jgi:hypothetical protein
MNRVFRNRCGILPLSGMLRSDQFRFTLAAKVHVILAHSC